MSDFLTRQQAADYLNIKKATLECWAWKGVDPIYYKFGKTVRYRLSDLENYITAQTQQPTNSSLNI